MCGKRLKDWKTIPIRRRTAFTSRAPVISSVGEEDAALVDPLEQVDAAQQRRLARARRADQRNHLVLLDGEVDAAQHDVLAERLRHPFDGECGHWPAPASRRRRSRATSQSVNRASGIVIATNSTAADEVCGVVEGRVRVDRRLLERLDRAERPDQRGVLLQADEVVEERRDDAAYRLREDHPPQGLTMREAERAGRRLLARVDRLDPGAVHLADVCAVDEDERDDPPEDHRRRDVAEPERRRAERRASRSRGSSGCRGRDRCRRSRARGAGRTPVPAGCEAPRGTSAKTRMNTSAMQKIFTFSRNARAISGNVALNSPQLKKVRRTSGQPGACVIATATSDEEHRGARGAR